MVWSWVDRRVGVRRDPGRLVAPRMARSGAVAWSRHRTSLILSSVRVRPLRPAVTRRRSTRGRLLRSRVRSVHGDGSVGRSRRGRHHAVLASRARLACTRATRRAVRLRCACMISVARSASRWATASTKSRSATTAIWTCHDAMAADDHCANRIRSSRSSSTSSAPPASAAARTAVSAPAVSNSIAVRHGLPQTSRIHRCS
jgi:hypothetical protein